VNLPQQNDAAQAKRRDDPCQTSVEGGEELRLDPFVKHLLAMPDVGEDADFERDSLGFTEASRKDQAGST